ncbi:flagellar brake protein [Brevibacillus fulvus]|uniref:C-di-GMP-binding flagellar brake protein YcgR n=1 Tax=Brevibacillus fulvus TaxID=1125967 RepID=A0A939BSV4_9BACL|nr:PilZ domain-containing protein [Brevibacillus fulvus]MBM7591137.1 c-di-GMP-binding flagellar brake protein YcgR [Brevibacillus fulvus]
MEIVEFWDGQLLVIEYEENTYFTQILKVTENFLSVQYPLSKSGVRMNIDYGKRIHVYFHMMGQGMYEFASTLTLLENQLSMLTPRPEEIKRTEKRNYFRVPAALAVAIETEEGKKARFTTEDVSGGGMAFFAKNHDLFQVGEKIKGSLLVAHHPEAKDISFQGKIVNVIQEKDKFSRISVEFIDMKEHVRREIISYCIRRQIDIRNKGKGFQR